MLAKPRPRSLAFISLLTLWVSAFAIACSGPESLDGVAGKEAAHRDEGSAGSQGTPSTVVSTVDATGNVRSETSITIGVDGLGLISYYDGENGHLKVAHCDNAECTSATTSTVDSTGWVGLEASITIGADGLGLISYHDASNGDLKVAHCDDHACTSAITSTLDASAINVGWSTSITTGADGLGLISYHDASNGDLKVAHCDNPACTSAKISTVDSNGEVGGFTSITIGIDGLGLISYFDRTNSDLKVAHCNDSACTSAATSTIDSTGNLGWYPSITIGADGLGLISYFRNVDGALNFCDDDECTLKVAHCEDISCTSATTSTLDSWGEVGRFTSITTGADGLGLISYYNKYHHTLQVAHCSNAACSSATTSIVDTDSEGLPGFDFTSITIGADGLGLISYRDATTGNLKVAHCGNKSCAP